jgi:hypothetical protein
MKNVNQGHEDKILGHVFVDRQNPSTFIEQTSLKQQQARNGAEGGRFYDLFTNEMKCLYFFGRASQQENDGKSG